MAIFPVQYKSRFALLAQGIERSAPDRKAAGSNPVECRKKEVLVFQDFFFL